MTSKTMMMVMALSATLVLGTFSMSPAQGLVFDESGTYAFKVGDKIWFKSIGPATCTSPSGASCGTGDLKSKTLLLVQNADETSASGVGKAKMALAIESNGVQLKGQSLGFVLDYTNEIVISGPLKAPNGNTWQMNMTVNGIDLATNTGNCNTELTSPGGAIMVSDAECGVVLTPITG